MYINIHISIPGIHTLYEEQRTQRAFRGYVSYESTHRSASGDHGVRLGCFVEKRLHVNRLGTSLRGQTRISELSPGCLSPGTSEVQSARMLESRDE